MTEIERPAYTRKQPSWPAIRKGLMCRCPKCGKAWLFHDYIEQIDRCPACGEPLAYYRTGLLLPLIVTTVAVFVVAMVMLYMELTGQNNPLVYFYVLLPLCIIVPLVILPPVKGGIIGLLWANNWSEIQNH